MFMDPMMHGRGYPPHPHHNPMFPPHHPGGPMMPPLPFCPNMTFEHMQAAATLAAAAAGINPFLASPFRQGMGMGMPTPMRTPSRQQQQQQQQSQPNNGTWTTPMRTPGATVQQGNLNASLPQTQPATEKGGAKYCRRVERELGEASKVELIDLLMELSAMSNEIASFVESKAQLFALRNNVVNTNPAMNMSAEISANVMVDSTPLKQQMSHCSGADCPAGVALNGGLSPQTPMVDAQHDLHSRHTTTENRPFLEPRHPCLRAYGGCRYNHSCLFAQCPGNLCLNWLRGQCANGVECQLVHRLPDDASEAVQHLYRVSRMSSAERVSSAAPFESGGTPGMKTAATGGAAGPVNITPSRIPQPDLNGSSDACNTTVEDAAPSVC